MLTVDNAEGFQGKEWIVGLLVLLETHYLFVPQSNWVTPFTGRYNIAYFKFRIKGLTELR